MKKTIFEVHVNCGSNDAETRFANIAARVKALPGVEAVDGNPNAAICKCLVRVMFTDADEAKQIHAAIMGVFTSDPSIQVTGLGTHLKDVFG